jgi:hypothetical protein
MIEGHGRFNVPTSITIARDIERYDPFWFEEPVPPESIDALAAVRRKSPVPIAAGERYYETSRFYELIQKDAVDNLQPDVSHVGGPTEARRIAAIAHSQFMPIAPHNPLGPVANAMTLQVAASIPNFAVLETLMTDVPWRSEIAIENVVVNGMMQIPTAPGLGVDLDEEACRAHPYKPYDLRHYKGTLTDIRPDEAATVDGANPFQVFYKIILPPSAAGIFAVGLCTFLLAWNSYVWPLILTTREEYFVLPLAIVNMAGQLRVGWGEVMAATVIAAGPVLIIFSVLERYLLR